MDVNEIVEDKSGKVSISEEDKLIEERKKKLIKFVKERYSWVTYVLLGIVVYISVHLRTRNLAGLRDITTGSWTLGPDLDPFLFLRWAKYIVEHGSLYAMDMMRYVPLGYDTKGELLLGPYMIAWFHKFASFFGSESVTQSAVIYPVFFFAITVIAFFLMTRKIFVNFSGEKVANAVALVASFFLSIMPSLLPRTIAGIPEKESAAFFFLFITFYFFLCAFEAKSFKNRAIFSILSAITTAMMALVWGGAAYIFVTITGALFLFFILGKIEKNQIIIPVVCITVSLFLANLFSSRYSLEGILGSTVTLLPIGACLLIVVNYLFFETSFRHKTERLGLFKKLSYPISALLIVAISLGLVVVMVEGVEGVYDKIKDIAKPLISPVSDRVGVTVAENRQPFFGEWASSFGPQISGYPLSFWLLFIGSVYLFYHFSSVLKKEERVKLTLAYLFFLISVVFSRYAPDSLLNGSSKISLVFYALGGIILIGSTMFYYYRYYRSESILKLKRLDYGIILLFVFFFFSLVSARSSVRTIMVLVPTASIMIAYLSIKISVLSYSIKDKQTVYSYAVFILTALILVSTFYSGYYMYKASEATAQTYVPSVYTQQWQKAMAWVRENTPIDAVFGHWWDYGYWLQSIGERATVLDGGNAKAYWNHLMGRYALTGRSNQQALEYLYAHKTTHFLIDSSDIGKYGAFSSIGSDAYFDRLSYIPEMIKNEQGTRETKNGTAYFYQGGFSLDEDIVYEVNGSRTYLPAGLSGVGGVVIEKIKNNTELVQPQAIMVYQGTQYSLPLRYAYYNNELIDYGNGLEAGVFIYPLLIQSQAGAAIDPEGALLYLSNRTVKSQLARLYLYEEENQYFNLVHSEDDLFVAQIKQQNPAFEWDFISAGGLRGPIRIWEINYPSDIEVKEEYLDEYYPPELLTIR